MINQNKSYQQLNRKVGAKEQSQASVLLEN